MIATSRRFPVLRAPCSELDRLGRRMSGHDDSSGLQGRLVAHRASHCVAAVEIPGEQERRWRRSVRRAFLYPESREKDHALSRYQSVS